MNSAVYCKTVENVRNRVDIRLITDKEDRKIDIKIKLYATKNI